MKQPHLLMLGNSRKVKENLTGILSQEALDIIEAEIQANAAALLALSKHHFAFAVKQSPPNWRQRVSRLYYATYCACRAVRLFKNGEFSTDVKDHQKVDNLPDDFPSRSRYVNQISMLREDRNTCDYDHLARSPDLILGSKQSTILTKEFIDDVKSYLQQQGCRL